VRIAATEGTAGKGVGSHGKQENTLFPIEAMLRGSESGRTTTTIDRRAGPPQTEKRFRDIGPTSCMKSTGRCHGFLKMGSFKCPA
jgi:hypothetical protein